MEKTSILLKRLHLITGMVCAVLSHSVVSNSLQPHGLQPARLLCPWDSPGKNIGVGCHALPQSIFPTEGLNPGLPCYRWILYCLSAHTHTEEWYTLKFFSYIWILRKMIFEWMKLLVILSVSLQPLDLSVGLNSFMLYISASPWFHFAFLKQKGKNMSTLKSYYI